MKRSFLQPLLVFVGLWASTVSASTLYIGGSITTPGGQTYGSPVVLTNATVLTSTGGGEIIFSSTVDGGYDLTINTAGATTFGGAVGNATPLASLTTDVIGTTAINGGAITTVGSQAYNDPVTLGANTVLSASTVTFGNTANGAWALTVNAPGTTFGGAVGNSTPLASLTFFGATVAINGESVTTSGAQTFFSAVTLGANAILTGNAVTFAWTVNGASELTVNAPGATEFWGQVGGATSLSSLATDAVGTTFINGGAVTTTGMQSYGDAVTLGANTTLLGDAVAFDSTVNGAFALTVHAPGTTAFQGAVGNSTPLTSLVTDMWGTTAINGGSVTTSGAQTFSDAVTLGHNTTLSGSAVSFGWTVSGGISALTVNGGTITLNGNVTTASSINFHSGINGSGNISFGPGVTIEADVQSYRAGDGVGGAGTGSIADLVNNAPSFVNFGGTTAPNHFTFWQDAAIANFPSASQFGGTLPAAYTIRSDDGAVHLAGMTLPGTLEVVADSAIDQAGPLHVVGSAWFSSSGSGVDGNISLSNAGNDFSTVTVSSGHNVTLTDGTDIDLGASTIDGNLDVAAGGTITDSGDLHVLGTTTLAAPIIILDNANNFSTVKANSAGDVWLRDTSGINLGESVISGNLHILAAGLVDFVNVGMITINGAMEITTAAGGINDSGPGGLMVFGTTTLAVGAGNDITLDNNNNFGTVTVTSGRNVILADNYAIDLGASTVSGALEVRAGGALTQSGTLSVGGSSTFYVTAPDGDISLGSQPNYLNGNVTLGGLGAGTVRDVSLRNSSPGAVSPALPAGLRHLTLHHDTAPLTLPALSVSGNVTLSSGGITTISAPVNAASLVTDLNGTTALNGGTVTTSGSQTYNDAVTLGAYTTLSGADVTFNSMVNGAGNSLTVNASGTTTFGGSVTGVDSLTSDASGTTVVNGPVDVNYLEFNDSVLLNNDVATYAPQDYGGAVTLGGSGATRTLSGLYVFFRDTVTGEDKNLTVSCGEEISFGGAVSGVNALATPGPAQTTINGPVNAALATFSGKVYLNNDVTTSGGQTYQKLVTLAGARTLSCPDTSLYGGLSLGIRGPTPGTQYDQLSVSGTAHLEGPLNVSLAPAYQPATGTGFQVLNYSTRSGMFSRIYGLEFGTDQYLNPILSATSLTLVSTNGLANRPEMSIAMQETGETKVCLTGIPGRPYVIQATTNLTTWTDLFTDLALTDGIIEFVDDDCAAFPWRFYRAMELPD